MKGRPRHIVLRDMKRGLVELKHGVDGEEAKVTLLNQFIPDHMMKETNPNHPLEADIVHAFDVSRHRWYEFKASEIVDYRPPFGDNSGQTNQERATTTTGERGTRDHGTESVQATQEAKADDRGAEGQGEGEPGQGKSRTWSSKDQ